MKKLLVIFTIFGCVYSANSFAGDKTPAIVSKSFQASFNNAQDVSWSEASNLYKAAFTTDGQSIFAFFNSEGNLVASARNISLLQLPLSLQTGLKNNFQNYTVSNSFEVDNEAGVSYYVTVESNTAKLQLKATSGGEWESYNRSRM